MQGIHNEMVLVLFANPVPYFNGTKSVRIDFSVWGTYDWDEHGPLVRLENHGNAEEIFLKRGDEIRVTQAHRGSSTGRTHRTYMFSHK